MNKKTAVGIQAREKVLKGANYLADAVRSTLGPYGMNALLEKGNRVTNDGVTIAKEIWLPDELENRGVCVLREAAIKTNDEAGDGTTTAITLAQAILKESNRLLANEKTFVGKMTPSELIKTLEKERVEITNKLSEMKTEIKSEEQLINSAKVSVENDELAKLIGSAQWKLGKEGVLIAEDTTEKTCSIQEVKGIRIDNGFGTSMIINNEEKGTLEIKDTYVILTNYTFQDFRPIEKIINEIIRKQNNGQTKKNIVIVARAFTEMAIKLCMENIHQGSCNIFPINAPYTDQIEVMKDLEVVLGGRFFSTENGDLEDMMISDVGFANKIVAKRYSAIFTGEENEKMNERIEKRVGELKKRIIGETSEFEKKNIESRIAQLTNGFAIVKIGATSDTERQYKLDKSIDAVNAVRAALQEGVVPGAGLAFKKIAEQLPDTYILKRPLNAIYEQICTSAPQGFTVPEWVMDPVKVLRVALEKACSVAGVLASTAIVVANENPKPKYVQEVKE